MVNENKMSFKRGDVVLANLGNKEGSIQWGVRPVIILSNDKNNYFSSVLTVVPLTTSKFKKRLPTHVDITQANSKIEKDSIALCEQTRIILKEYILRDQPLFTLSDELMSQIEYGVMVQLGLTQLVQSRMAV